jgi:hypothetical protein
MRRRIWEWITETDEQAGEAAVGVLAVLLAAVATASLQSLIGSL